MTASGSSASNASVRSATPAHLRLPGSVPCPGSVYAEGIALSVPPSGPCTACNPMLRLVCRSIGSGIRISVYIPAHRSARGPVTTVPTPRRASFYGRNFRVSATFSHVVVTVVCRPVTDCYRPFLWRENGRLSRTVVCKSRFRRFTPILGSRSPEHAGFEPGQPAISGAPRSNRVSVSRGRVFDPFLSDGGVTQPGMNGRQCRPQE